MSSFLRFVGIVNASVWFGAGIFFAAAILPAVFSQDMHRALGIAADSPYYTYYPGAIALILFRRYFVLQYICGLIALLHLFAEKLYLGRAIPRAATAVVVAIFCLGLAGGFWLQPKMQNLRQTIYTSQNAEAREKARHSFDTLHHASTFSIVCILGGLMYYLLRVTKPAQSDRYSTFTIFRS